jgi:hypothetical protein
MLNDRVGKHQVLPYRSLSASYPADSDHFILRRGDVVRDSCRISLHFRSDRLISVWDSRHAVRESKGAGRVERRSDRLGLGVPSAIA